MRELDGIFFSDAVRGTGDDCIGAFGAVFSELRVLVVRLGRNGELTFVPLNTNRDASMRK